jgi:DNA-binding transcriptional ArsR family regulator
MPALITPLELDQTLFALADSTRRAILQRLSNGEARVTELARPFAMSLNAVSKHIRILERAGLVHRHCIGREHILTLNARPLDEVTAWMNAQRIAWATRLDTLEALLRSNETRSNETALPLREKKQTTGKKPAASKTPGKNGTENEC